MKPTPEQLEEKASELVLKVMDLIESAFHEEGRDLHNLDAIEVRRWFVSMTEDTLGIVQDQWVEGGYLASAFDRIWTMRRHQEALREGKP